MDQQTIDAIGVGLVRVSGDERVLACNMFATELLGTVLVNRHYTVTFRDPHVIELIDTTLGGEASGDVHIQRRVKGEQVWLRISAARLADGGIWLTIQDASSERAASQSRSDFVANVSHELRTPLTAITGLIETLQGPAGRDPDAHHRFLDMMSTEADRMNRLVADLLTLSRAETEDRTLFKLVDLCEAVSDAKSSLSEQAQARGSDIVVIADEKPAQVKAHPDQLRQLFNNLLENALKYGAQGAEIRVLIGASEMQALLGRVGYRVDIVDQGDGIPQSHIARLTERFYRVDAHRSRDTGGTGLGLSIVKHILQGHGGTLRISSEIGRGSTFSVILPKG